MGTWSTGISSSDEYSDIYEEFFEQYHEGKTPEEITQALLDANPDMLVDPDQSHDAWFALAKAQWECKALDPAVFARVKDIIESGRELARWRDGGASERDIAKRDAALRKFLASLSMPRAKARARKKVTNLAPAFATGQCLSFRLENGNYGGFVVLATKYGKLGANCIAVTRINQPTKPTLQDFARAEIMLMNFPNWENTPVCFWYMPTRDHHEASLVELVAELKIRKLGPESTGTEHAGNLAYWFIGSANRQFEHEIMHPRPDKRLYIKAYLYRPWWRPRWL